MSGEMAAFLGVLVSVIFGVAAFFIAKSINSHRQSQKVDQGGTGYQAGRDLKITKEK